MKAYLEGGIVRIGNVKFELATGVSWETEQRDRAGLWCCEVPDKSWESARFAARLADADYEFNVTGFADADEHESVKKLKEFYEANKHKIRFSWQDQLNWVTKQKGKGVI